MLDKSPPEYIVDALRAAKTGVWHWDIADDRVAWDEAICHLFAVKREDAPRTAAEFMTFVHPADRQRVSEYIRSSIDRRSNLEYEFRAQLRDGSIKWIYDRSAILMDDAGAPRALLGTCTDITMRKEAELALAESEARLALATTAGNLGIWDWDLQTNRMIYSDRAKEIFGFPIDRDVSFEQVRDATHPEDHPRTSAMARRALDPAIREHIPYEYRIIRGDDTIRWVVAHGHAVFEQIDGIDRAIRYVGTIRDVTERKLSEQALRTSESRLRLALDAGRMAVWEFDARTGQLGPSTELNRLLGFPPDARPTREELQAGYQPGELERVREAGAAALAKGERFVEADFQYRRPDGVLRWLLLRAEVFLDEARNVDRVIGVLLDITDQKLAAERQRMLMGELTHRVKNTLAIIQSMVSQTLRHATDPATARGDIEGRIQSLARAHDVLTAERWEGAFVTTVVEKTLSPFMRDATRVRWNGPELMVGPRQALDLTMLLHELGTNATKHGALSTPVGSVALDWTIETQPTGRKITLHWQEEGGPPVMQPTKSGFGTRLIEGIASQCDGAAQFDYAASGFHCVVSMMQTKEV